MAIKSIDALAGAELVRPKLTFPDTRRATSPAAAVDTTPKVPAQADKDKDKAEPHKPTEAGSTEVAASDNTILRFDIDQDTGKPVAKLVDTSGQVLRQIPSKEALELAKALNKCHGTFVNRKV